MESVGREVKISAGWNVIDEGKNGCRWNLMRKEGWSMRPNNGRCVTDGNSGGMFPGRSVWVMGQ